MKNPYPYTPDPIDPKSGQKFYGRQEYIDKILNSNDKVMLILGARRIGKTSLLKQIEYLSNPPSYIGVYLDLSDLLPATQERFAEELGKSCQNEFFEQIEFDVKKLRGDNLFESLSKLDEGLRKKSTQLILLCDESERFANFDEPFLKSIQSFIRYESQMIRLILTASQGIYKLYEVSREWTPPFLHEVPEVTLSRLTNDEAESLIRQVDFEGKPVIEVSDKTVSEIQRLTDNQPFLINCLCSVLSDSGRLLDVNEQHLKQTFDSYFLSEVFFDLWKVLSPKQGIVLLQFREAQTMSESKLSEKTRLSYEIKLDLRELTRLCYIKKLEGGYQISNPFFSRWLDSVGSKYKIKRKEIKKIEQRRVLEVIRKSQMIPVSGIYARCYLEKYKIYDIVEYCADKKLIKKFEPAHGNCSYFSITWKGKLYLAILKTSPRGNRIWRFLNVFST